MIDKKPKIPIDEPGSLKPSQLKGHIQLATLGASTLLPQEGLTRNFLDPLNTGSYRGLNSLKRKR